MTQTETPTLSVVSGVDGVVALTADRLAVDEIRGQSPPLAMPSTFVDARPRPTAAAVDPRLVSRPVTDVLKRTFDIVVSLLCLVLTLPLLLLIALAVCLDSPGSPLFRQRRLGRDRSQFELLKFRSMRADAEGILHADPELHAEFLRNNWKLPKGSDPRITRVGAFLRTTSLDELPQLVNVLLGHMSLVGPRPPRVAEISSLFGDDESLYYSVRPGMTGAWQVSGRSDLSGDERRAIDVDYITTRSLLGDLRLLVATVPAVLSRRGAF